MPHFKWNPDPTIAVRDFESRHGSPEAGALLFWATSTVESLYYLDDLDVAHAGSIPGLGVHRPDTIDVAHTRWATGSCVTAIDLCAAALGRAVCGNTSARDFGLAYFDPTLKNGPKNRRNLPPAAVSWIDGVLADPAYAQLIQARHSLTHSRIVRHFTLNTSGPDERLRLQVGASQVSVRELIEAARDCGTRHVQQFVSKLANI